MFGDETEAVLFDALAFGATQMRSQNHPPALLSCVIDCGYRCANAGVIFNLAVYDGNIEIYADEDAFTFEIEVPDGEL